MLSRQIVFSLLFVSRLVACSCASYEPVTACQIVYKTPVVFRGRVIDDNHDPTTGFAQMALYRVEILETFKGVPAGITEVSIDPASGTSCYTEFSKGKAADVQLLDVTSLRCTPNLSIKARHAEFIHFPSARQGTCH